MKREVKVSGIRRLLSLPASGRRVERDVDDEIRFHIESRVAELIAAGTPPPTAREIATREFGNVTEARAEIARVDHRRLTRERRQAWWETVGQDLAYSARSLRSQPGFSAVVVLVLALGIGANVTMFGVIDRLLLRAPALVTDPEHVVSLAMGRTIDGGDREQRILSYPIYRDMRSASRAFEHVAAYSPDDMAFGRGRDARELRGMRVTANYFATLGVRPAVGRFFVPEEDGNPIAPRVLVLGYGFWQRQFEGDRSAVGRTLTIGEDEYTIVGVAPEGFTGVESATIDAWVPLTANITVQDYESWLRSRQAFWLRVIGRLRPGVTAQQAGAVATSALRAGAVAAGQSPREVATIAPSIRLVSVLPRQARANTPDAKVAVLLAAVSILVLLIACANVANLQLARGIARQREVAVRIALGIDRARLVRQLVSETVLLALAAGVAAILVTIWGGGIFRRVLFTSDMAAASAVDPRLVAYTALAAIAAGIVSGFIAALQASRPAVADALRAGARAGGPARSRTRTALLVIQAALTVVFLVGATLFVRSLQRIQALPLGMEPHRVLVVSARTSGMRITSAETAALYTRLLDAARAAPGVEHAALGIGLPFASSWAEEVSVPGRDSVPLTRDGGPYFNAVTADFFATLGMRILRGRGFADADRGGSARVVVVNQTLADLWWPNEDAIGQCMKVGGDTMPCAQVVGVAENARRQSVIEDPAVQFFVPLEQAPSWTDARVLFVRPAGDAKQALESLRRELQTRLPDAPFIEVSRLEELVSPQMRAWRLGATAFGAFGLLAVVVAALGLYSLLAYDVSRRLRELGIRVALGAGRSEIIRMVVGRAVRVAVVGALTGFAIAIAAGPTVSPLLFETSARDPIAFAVAAAILFVVALLAAVVPTRRAARVDPIIALRAD
jgi:putative ABC transport system permease protein